MSWHLICVSLVKIRFLRTTLLVVQELSKAPSLLFLKCSTKLVSASDSGILLENGRFSNPRFANLIV